MQSPDILFKIENDLLSLWQRTDTLEASKDEKTKILESIRLLLDSGGSKQVLWQINKKNYDARINQSINRESYLLDDSRGIIGQIKSIVTDEK